MKKIFKLFVVVVLVSVSCAELYSIHLANRQTEAHRVILNARAQGRITDTQARNLDRYARDTYSVACSERVINLLNRNTL